MFSFFDIPTWNKVVRRTYRNSQPIALFDNSNISYRQLRLYLFNLFNFSIMAKKLLLLLVLILSFSTSYAQKASGRHLEEGLFTLKADAQSATISKEIIDLRDEYSKTYINSEGVYTKQSSDFPMHYRGNDGQWYTYDKQMTLAKTGIYTIEKTDVPVSFNPSDGATVFGYNKSGGRLLFGQKTFFKITDKAGNVVTSSSDRNLASLRFDQEANRITQQNYWQGTDRRIKFDLSEVETDYVFNSKPAWLTQDQFVHFTEVYQIPSGASIVEGVGENGAFGFKGELTLRDANGEDLVLFNLPMCYDQTYFTEKYGKATRPILGEYVHQIVGNELYLTTVVPASWILDDERVFPVVIDPTASSYQGGIYPFERYNYGCSYTVGVNVPAGTITGWYAQWQVTATGGGYMSEGRSQIGLNAAYQGQFQGSGSYGGTYNVNTPTYTNNNGNWGGGSMTFWWRGYRTWGSLCCCNTSYQRRNYLYVYVNYIDVPANPSAANSNVNPLCNPGQTVTLTASNPIGTVYWYTGGCGSTFIGTGTSINVNPNSTTTYFCRNYANGYFSNGCASTTVTVSGAPAAPTANPVSIFCGQTASLTASGNGTFTWYANSNGSGQLGTGANYTTPVLNATTTFYVNQNVSGCVSALTPVTVTANVPSTPTANDVTINCNQTASLSASSNGGMTWYANSNGTGQVGTGANFSTPSLSQTTTYYVQAGSGGCASQIVPVTVTVPQAQTPSSNNASINCQSSTTLSSAANNSTLYWYSNANGTGQVGTGVNYTTPVLTSNTTYYIQAGTGACASQLVPVTVTINPASNPSVNNASVNCGSTTTLTASSNAPIIWYSNSNATGQVGSGNSYTTPQIYAPVTFYLQAGAGACASQIVPVTAAPNVQQPSASNVSTNCATTATLTASGANSYVWYSDAAGTNQVGTNANFTTPVLSANTTYYVGGASAAAQSSTQVYTITSTAQLFNMGSSCGAGSFYNCGGGLRGFNWNDNLPAGTVITNVQIQLSFGVKCSNGSVQTLLNNNNGSSITPNAHCNCSGTNNGIFTLNFPGNQYVVGGANQFRFNYFDCIGLFNGNGALSGQFARVTVTYQNQPCISPLVPVLVTVNQAQAPSAASQTVNCQSAATISGSSSSPITWFANANGTGQLATGANYTTPALNANTTYYMQSGTGACASQLVPVTVTVSGAQAPTANNVSTNCQTTATLNAGANNSPLYWFSNANGTGQVGTGASYTTPVLTGNTTYYLQAGTGACASQLVPVTVSVTQAQAPSVNNSSVNCGATATLTASANSPIYWFSNSNGTGQIGTGNSYTSGQAIYAPVTVYVQAGTGACASQLVPVTAAPNASVPSAQNANTSCGSPVTLTASGANGYAWFSNANATGQVGNSANFTTPSLNNNTTYYVASITGGGVSNFSHTSATQSVYNNCGAANFVVPSTPAASSGATLTVYVRGDINSSSETVSVNSETGFLGNIWGGSQCGGFLSATYNISQATLSNWVANGSISLSFNSSCSVDNICGFAFQAYFTISYQSGSPACTSSVVPVQVTVNPLAAPTVSGNTTVCSNGSTTTTLTASGSPNGYAWFTNANGTGQVGSNASFTTPGLNSNTTYYVQATSNGCLSNLVPVNITVNALPAAPSANNPSICAGQTATINASANANWYTVPAGGASIGQAQNYTTPSLNNNVTYYMEGVNGPCVSATRTPVTVTVNASPASNAGASIVNTSTCGKDMVNIGGNALAAGQTGQWTVVSAQNNAGGFQGLFANGGVQANDQFTGTYGGTYVLKWAVTNSANGCIGEDTMVVTFHQPVDASLAGLIGQGDVLWCGLTGSDWSTSTNWYLKQPANGNYPNGYYQRMSGAVQPAINNEVFSINQANGGMCIGTNNINLSSGSNAEDVYVGTGITLNLSNQTANVAQNFINNGTIIASTGTVNFTGASNGTISGSGNTQLFDMTVNKSQGATLTLQQPVLVTNTLTMTQGNVFTSNNNLLTLGTSSAAPGTLSYNTGTIVGPFKRYFTNAATNGNEGLFPVGTSTYNRYASFSFGSTPGVDQFLTVEYVPGAPMQGGSPLYNGLPCIASGALIQNYSADGYWSVVPTSNNYTAPITTAPYSVTLFANNLTGMQTPQICRIIKSAGSNNAAQHHVAWQGCGTHTAINAGVSPQAFAITSTAVQGFSWFNIGTSNNQALPVELVSFNGSCESEEVKLTWQTATEHNSSYYEVEKSRDGMEWQVLTTVTAAGNSTQLLNYETMDAHAMEGNNYYRLTQVDIDGTRKTYDAINVSCSGSTKGYFSAYPNPSTGAFQVILNDKKLIGSSVLTVRDTKGAELLNRSIEVKPGINMFNVSDLNLAPGVYYLQIVNGERTTEVLKEVIR